MRSAQIYLASGSPRRRELLTQMGIRFERLSVDVDEALQPGETPVEHVGRLALAKAAAGRAVLKDRPILPVLGADTVVVLDDDILGKPENRAHALEMLARMSGRTHNVVSAVALHAEQTLLAISESRVKFRKLAPAECLAYWRSGEPVDKAGAYAIQGLGAVFVEHLEGSYSGVMGLPIFETARLLHAVGITIPEE